MTDWKDKIKGFNEEEYNKALKHIPIGAEELDKILELAITFGCQPAKCQVPLDGCDEIKAQGNLMNFLRNLYVTIKKNYGT